MHSTCNSMQYSDIPTTQQDLRKNTRRTLPK